MANKLLMHKTIDTIKTSPVAHMRAVFASPFCQCARAKRMWKGELFCSRCLAQLPANLRKALDEVELVESLIKFYCEASDILRSKRHGK